MTDFAWHVHHKVLVEPLTEPIENRIAYIRKDKPADEIELRLRLLKLVRGSLPAEYVEAAAEYARTGAKYKEGWAKYQATVATDKEAWIKYLDAGSKLNAAGSKYRKTWVKYGPEIEALHAIECPDCPWTGHPGSIFGSKLAERFGR